MSRIFAIIIAVILALPIGVCVAEDLPVTTELPALEELPVVEASQPKTADTAESIKTDTLEQLTPNASYKKPLSKRKIALKFLMAMGGVVLSSFMIYILLTVYNRIREGVVVPPQKREDTDALETPDDYESAVKSFLDKTDWKY